MAREGGRGRDRVITRSTANASWCALAADPPAGRRSHARAVARSRRSRRLKRDRIRHEWPGFERCGLSRSVSIRLQIRVHGLIQRDCSKPRVAGSNPVSRSMVPRAPRHEFSGSALARAARRSAASQRQDAENSEGGEPHLGRAGFRDGSQAGDVGGRVEDRSSQSPMMKRSVLPVALTGPPKVSGDRCPVPSLRRVRCRRAVPWRVRDVDRQAADERDVDAVQEHSEAVEVSDVHVLRVLLGAEYHAEAYVVEAGCMSKWMISSVTSKWSKVSVPTVVIGSSRASCAAVAVANWNEGVKNMIDVSSAVVRSRPRSPRRRRY